MPLFGHTHEDAARFDAEHGITEFNAAYRASHNLDERGREIDPSTPWTPDAAEARLVDLAGQQAFDNAEANCNAELYFTNLKRLQDDVKTGKISRHDAIERAKQLAGATEFEAFRNSGKQKVNIWDVEKTVKGVEASFKPNRYGEMPKTERVPAQTFNSNGDITYVRDLHGHIVYFDRAIPEDVIMADLKANQEYDANLIFKAVSTIRLAEINATTHSVTEADIGEVSESNWLVGRKTVNPSELYNGPQKKKRWSFWK